MEGGSLLLILPLKAFALMVTEAFKFSWQERTSCLLTFRGAGAGPAGTAAAGPMLEAKLMNLIKGRLQKF